MGDIEHLLLVEGIFTSENQEVYNLVLYCCSNLNCFKNVITIRWLVFFADEKRRERKFYTSKGIPYPLQPRKEIVMFSFLLSAVIMMRKYPTNMEILPFLTILKFMLKSNEIT